MYKLHFSHENEYFANNVCDVQNLDRTDTYTGETSSGIEVKTH